ncbi:MAG TPA: hypothetical protein VK494_04105 [Gemmatimonadaceae bacterium]|jgi:hypothetical protein|nr:hypothetical protein [Gemmatimonadaceae bacterium]
MLSRSPSIHVQTRVCVGLLLFAGGAAAPAFARAQTTQALPILSAEATPIGALPPIALPMPASRDNNYWGLRLQTGQRRQRGGPEDLFAIAAGIDYQVRGGSIFGVTGGYQWRQNCQAAITDCGGHSLFGARARFNFMTGGPTLAAVWGDNDATSTLGTEVGFGYAPSVTPGLNACTVDIGLPFSIATLERIHLVSFVTPGVVWDVDCSAAGTKARTSYLIGFGLGVQQLGFRGLDVHVGAQRMFRGATGLQFGVSVSWVRLP